MWRISLMAAAHGDPLRQSQRRSRHGDTREDLYPIDFQAYQMSPTCASGYRCSPADDAVFGLPEDTTILPSGLAVVSQDAFFPQDLDKPINKPPTRVIYKLTYLMQHVTGALWTTSGGTAAKYSR